ncbi:MAG: ABC transporter permease [Thermodesulfobacteriota bacterium]|nr:ABC transporter permease [Thermodesulfobacteriota bacterium]
MIAKDINRNIYISTSKVSLIKRLKELLNYRGLLWILAWRDIRVRYKQSVLGFAWAMFVPLSMMLVFTFIFTLVIRIKTDMPYPIFVFCGLLPWQFFATSTTGAANSLIANRNLVTKIYFPAEVFPLSCVLASFIDFLVGCIVLIGMMIFYSLTSFSIPIGWVSFLVLPVLLVQLIFTSGLSYFLAMGNLFFRDVRYVYNVIIMLWMFASSVIYPLKTSNLRIQFILNLNPMTPILNSYRDVLLRGKPPDWGPFLYSAGVGIGILILGWIIFFRMQYKFAEKI